VLHDPKRRSFHRSWLRVNNPRLLRRVRYFNVADVRAETQLRTLDEHHNIWAASSIVAVVREVLVDIEFLRLHLNARLVFVDFFNVA
jgi:hypothetical protein